MHISPVIFVGAASGSAASWPWWGLALAFVTANGLWATILIAHESAHALIAELAGCRVAEISLGKGPVLGTARFAGVRITVRVLPLGGHTQVMPTKGMPWGLIVGAGPVMDLIVAIAGYSTGGTIGRALGTFAAFTFVGNILPWRPQSPGALGSDGFQLLERWRGRRPSVVLQSRLRVVLEAQSLLDRGDANGARAWVDHGLAAAPHDLGLRAMQVFVALALEDPARARELAVPLLADGRLSETLRPAIQNALAWSDLLLDDPTLIPEALDASGAAVTSRSGDRPIQGTRGWALIEAGRVDEGLGLCRRSMRARIGRRGRDVTRCTIAIGLARQGRLNAAENQLGSAGRRLAGSDLFLRARREVDDAWVIVGAEAHMTDVTV